MGKDKLTYDIIGCAMNVHNFHPNLHSENSIIL